MRSPVASCWSSTRLAAAATPTKYTGLEALDERRGGEGLTIVGVPPGDFRQAPSPDGPAAHRTQGIAPLRSANSLSQWQAEDEQVERFCRLNYHAAVAARPVPAGGEPSWNLTKYLRDRDRRLVARLEATTAPDAPELIAIRDALLAEPAGVALV